VVGWATAHRQTTSLIINALKSAVSRTKKSEIKVILHSDQGSKYSSYEYRTFLKHHNIIPSMSRRGNCYDNAVVESFFARSLPLGYKTLKKELVRKHVFLSREVAASKIFEYIEIFYNPKRRHSYLGYISPNEFEKRYNLEASKNKLLTE
jgi:putative transposase